MKRETHCRKGSSAERSLINAILFPTYGQTSLRQHDSCVENDME
jgi:hypothetical protein